MSEGKPGLRRGEHFEEAIARWQLELQTEVKKASALPTAMFDACDPMLEAKLAETTEGIFSWLLRQMPPPGLDPTAAEELRLEHVEPHELAALMRSFAGPEPHAAEGLDLLEGLGREELGILADTCCKGDVTARQHAAFRLCRNFGLKGGDMAQLAAGLQAQLEGAGAAPAAAADPEAQFESMCRLVAAAVLRSLPTADGTSGEAR